MKIQTIIPDIKPDAKLQARLDRVNAIVSATSDTPRAYRFTNGLGTTYHVVAFSALGAVKDLKSQHGIPNPPFDKLQVQENGAWVYVI